MFFLPPVGPPLPGRFVHFWVLLLLQGSAQCSREGKYCAKCCFCIFIPRPTLFAFNSISAEATSTQAGPIHALVNFQSAHISGAVIMWWGDEQFFLWCHFLKKEKEKKQSYLLPCQNCYYRRSTQSTLRETLKKEKIVKKYTKKTKYIFKNALLCYYSEIQLAR